MWKIAKHKLLKICGLILLSVFFVGCDRNAVEDPSNIKMTIDLEFSNDQISASAILIPKVENNEFSFVVNNQLVIDEISSAEGSLEWTKKIIMLDFRPILQKITVTTNSDAAITIKYHGSVEGWFNFIESDKKVINFYSAWYPQEFSFPDDVDNEVIVKISNLSDYTVVNGTYNKKDEQWVYSINNDTYDDCNIIALKNGAYSVLSQEGINIYYCNNDELANATAIYDYCVDVLKYYNDVLYRDYKRDSNSINIVSFSDPGSQQGAYTREGLIVIDGFVDINEGTWMKEVFAHELGHLWAHGADTSSYEDWLNETAAEWSALLYLCYSNNQDIYDEIIESKTNEYADLPAIRTIDGSRPDGVHTKGTVLFHDIYEKYGSETIQKLLNVFVSLDEKNTENFIKEASLKLGDDIAAIILDGIQKK